MLNFDFLDKGLGIVSLAYFVYDFSTKILLMLHSINWPNFMPGCLYFLKYWAMCVLQLLVIQVCYSWQKLKYLENEKSFYGEIKSVFHHFERTHSQANNTNIFGRWESDFKNLCEVSIALYCQQYWSCCTFSSVFPWEERTLIYLKKTGLWWKKSEADLGLLQHPRWNALW